MIIILPYKTEYAPGFEQDYITTTAMNSIESWVTVKEDHGCVRCQYHKVNRFGFPGVVWKDVMSHDNFAL